MELDFKRSLNDQIEEFKVKTDNVDKSAREFSDESLIEFVEMFLSKIDYGEHSNNSYDHKIMAYEDIAQNILNNVSSITEFDMMKCENELELNRRILNYTFNSYRYNCRYCGEYFKTEVLPDRTLTNIKEVKEGRFANSYPPRKECYKEGVTKVNIRMKSSKFVIANDLRSAFKDSSIAFDDNINTIYGRINSTKVFAEKDIMCFNVGNTTIEFLKNKNKETVFTDLYITDIDDYWFSDEKTERIKFVNEFIESGKYKAHKNSISTGLWWIMGASSCDLNMNDINCDYIEYRVKKGSVYTLEFEYHKGNFYKFYQSSEE